MPRLPDLEAWAIFAKLAQSGSFARTAEELGLSKGSVSKAVARLEMRLGTSLLLRTSRRLALTEIGRSTARRAAQILADTEAMDAEAMAQSKTAAGLVRVTAPMSFGLTYLAPILPDLMMAHPQIMVDVHLTDEIVDLIGGGFDIALRIAELPDSSLRVRRLCQVRRLLVGAPCYFSQHARPEHPNDLTTHDVLAYTYLATVDRWRFLHIGGEEVSVTPTFRLRANNADALRPALLAGHGLALQPEFVIWKELRTGQLETVMTDWGVQPISLNLITPPSTLRPARVEAVIDFIARYLATAPWAMFADGERHNTSAAAP